jgi:Zn-dependent protease with chaperone function
VYFLILAMLVLGPLSAQFARSRWPLAAPRTAIVMWLALGACGFLAVIAAGVSRLPGPVHSTFFDRLDLFIHTLGTQPLRGLSATGVVGLSLSLDVTALLVLAVLVSVWRTSRTRSALRSVIDLVGTPWRGSALIIDFAEPTAYFLPGDGGRVVLSSALATSSDDLAIEAIVRHEHAHRTEHHSTLAVFSTALAPYFRFIPWVAASAVAVPYLCECAADDAARRSTSTDALRRALELVLIGGDAPSCALAMGREAVSQRLQRLDNSQQRWRGAAALWTLTVTFALTALSLGLVH